MDCFVGPGFVSYWRTCDGSVQDWHMLVKDWRADKNLYWIVRGFVVNWKICQRLATIGRFFGWFIGMAYR